MICPLRGMNFGKRACEPVSAAEVGLVPSFWWQLVQRTFDATNFGRLSGVNRNSARPRRIARPIESFGISDSAGGFHAVSSNVTAGPAAGACARSIRHAEPSEAAIARRAARVRPEPENERRIAGKTLAPRTGSRNTAGASRDCRVDTARLLSHRTVQAGRNDRTTLHRTSS